MEVEGGFHTLPRFNRECDKYNGGWERLFLSFPRLNMVRS